jgi:hypothetical protein
MHRDAPGLWCGMRYSFSIRNGDGSVREDFGSTDLLRDYVAHDFCDDVIRRIRAIHICRIIVEPSRSSNDPQ